MSSRFAGRVPVWAAAGAVSAVAGAAFLLALSPVRPPSGRFAGVVAVGLAVQAAGFVAVARLTDADPRHRFTLATAVTVVRGTAVVVLAGFLATGQPAGPAAWLPPLLFAAAALLDGLDGVVARALDAVSPFGTRLDAEVDGFTLLVGAAVAVRFGAAPSAYLAVGLARFAFVAGKLRRHRRGAAVAELSPSPVRPALFVFLLCVTLVILAPAVPAGISRPLATVGMVPFLAWFLRDWLAVSGRL